jgi:hypothetical protein
MRGLVCRLRVTSRRHSPSAWDRCRIRRGVRSHVRPPGVGRKVHAIGCVILVSSFATREQRKLSYPLRVLKASLSLCSMICLGSSIILCLRTPLRGLQARCVNTTSDCSVRGIPRRPRRRQRLTAREALPDAGRAGRSGQSARARLRPAGGRRLPRFRPRARGESPWES